MKQLLVYAGLSLFAGASYLGYEEYQSRTAKHPAQDRDGCLKAAKDYFSEYWGPTDEPPYHKEGREKVAACIAKGAITNNDTAAIRRLYQPSVESK